MTRVSQIAFRFLVLTISFGCVLAGAQDFTYTTNNGTLTITGYTGTNDDVVIPSTIDGLPVTSIGTRAFQLAPINTVSIPNGITSIGDYTFSGCSSLTNITIPDSVTNIGDYAFELCSLTKAEIPSSVLLIGHAPFRSCNHLAEISVDAANSAYVTLAGVLFDRTENALLEFPPANGTSYTIPTGVTAIMSSAFSDCSSLTNVTIPDSVTSIGSAAFSGCYSLTSVVIPNGITNIGDWVFSGCRSLTNVAIPNGVNSIGDGAFSDCYSLTSVTFPNGITSIGDSAFFGCLRLTSVTIPNGVTSIGNDTFNGCSSLTSVVIPNSITNIGDEVFFDCWSLTNVTIPNSVTSIGVRAFFTCSSLTCVTIPDSVTSIGSSAFSDCSSLTNVTIGDSVRSIGVYAFSSSGLKEVHFKGNAPTVDLYIFEFDGVVTAYYLPGTAGWGSSFGGIPTAFWSLPYPLLLNGSVGVRSNQFGFTVSWATNLSIVVEAAMDLGNPVWSPLATNTLLGGWFHFADPEWTNYPSRFYRVRSQ